MQDNMKTLLIFGAVLITLAMATPVEKVSEPTTMTPVVDSTTMKLVHVPLTQAEITAHVVEAMESTMMPTTTMMPESTTIADVKDMTAAITTTVQPTQAVTEKNCDLECTKLDLNPVCASNERCVHEFPNECVMVTYNCRHAATQQPFTIFKNEACDNELLDRLALERKTMKDKANHQHQPEGKQHQHLHPSLQQRCTPEDLNGFIAVTNA